jgi:hypothetical protein
MRAIMQGLTDAEFEQQYGTEEPCLAAWGKVRQDAGMACPRCGNPKSYLYDRRVGCTRCDMRWSITAGTVMADTKLPLATWFRAMHLMSSTNRASPQSSSAVAWASATRPPGICTNACATR